jgi:asparagine synthase (glutamine-hydrolysing)
MCGIAGWVGHAPAELLPAMLRLLKHRGPDGDGAYAEPDAAIGMTRLAIIDVAGGQQPMASDDGALRLVGNGEIYNYRALRESLAARGHRFHTRSDMEVALRAFEDYGEACVEHLRGMFALAIWDRARRRLFLARDRLGKKPLYYARTADGFVFASEPKALFCHPGVARDVDWDALHHYLAFGYTPAARSIFAGIGKIPPAHTAVLENGELRLRQYWTLPRATPAAPARADLETLVRQQLGEAVRLRLESDVPVGVFLSGGIDSSAVVASMREVTGGPIRTFSIGFGASAPSYDELRYARAVAERFGTEHHEEILEPRVSDLLPAIVHHFDEPFADSSAIPTFVVAQATARHVKVALSGIGGDETFAGYPRYLGVRLSQLYGALPRPLRAATGALARAAARDREDSRPFRDRLRRFVQGADQPLPDRYLGWTRIFGHEGLVGLATPALRAHFGADVERAARAAFAGAGHGDAVDGAFRIDLDTYLPDDLLTMADRMGMAHGLEVRAPFCDHRLIETSLAIPPDRKMPGFRLKALLKRAFADVLPREVLEHPKQGFMIPLGQWLRADLRPNLDDLLAPERVAARGLFVPAEVARLKREHLSGARSHADRLWSLMILELWIRQHLDARGSWALA